MKKKQVNEILTNQSKKRTVIFSFICSIIAVSLLAVLVFLIYIKRNQTQYVKYSETSNIDYKVLLKENNFFDNQYLESDKQYIASLIDYIKANFEYKLSLEEENVEYKYSYRIESNVDVKEKRTSNSLYNKSILILSTPEKTTTDKEVLIEEEIDIDYNYYNDLIKKFVKVYDLENVESILNINMYVNVISSCEEFTDTSKESVMNLSIPLTTNTIAIDLSNNLVNEENNIMKCESNYENNYIFLIIGIILTFISICLIILVIKYEIKSRTAENIYERELKKILNNYSSYIQTLSNDFKFEEYQILKVNTFNDMLEIRDTIRQPILMRENQEKTGAYFVIPSSTKVLYVYRLKVKDIRKEIRKR